MIINSATLNGIKTSFNVIFNKAFTEAPSQYKAIAMDVPSTAAENTYAWLGMTTKFREWVGDRVIQNLETHGYTIRNKKFENTVGVSEDDIEDDNLGVYTPLIQNLGYDAKVHPDELVFGLLEKGTDNKCYDGQYFFDTDHPVGKEKTSVSNFYTGSKPAWYLIDASRPVKPIVFQKRKITISRQSPTANQKLSLKKANIYTVYMLVLMPAMPCGRWLPVPKKS